MEGTMQVKKYGIKDLFSQRVYLFNLIAGLISRFGDSVDSIAYAWMVYTLTGSKLLMGSLFAVNAVPNIIFSPFAGVLVDRFEKKKAVILCHIGRGTIVGLTALLFMLKVLEPWHLFIFTFINSTFETFSMPASSALVPLILPQELFLTAQSFGTSIYKTVELIGLGCAGFIIAKLGISGAIFIDGFTFFAAALIIIFIKIQGDCKVNTPLTINKYFSELIEGLVYVKKNKLIFFSVILMAVINFCIAPLNVLQIVFVKDILKAGTEVVSLLGIALSMGMILSGLAVGQFGSNFKKSSLIIFGFIFIGMNYALLYLPNNINIFNISSIIMSAVFYFLLGFAIPLVTAPLTAYFLESTPKNILGRISALLSMICTCAIPLGSFFTGIVSEYISVQILFLTMGIVIIMVSLLLLLSKDFRKN